MAERRLSWWSISGKGANLTNDSENGVVDVGMIKKVYLSDPSLIQWAEKQPNFSQYVRRLIERDMAMAVMRDIAPGTVKLVDELVAAQNNITGGMTSGKEHSCGREQS